MSADTGGPAFPVLPPLGLGDVSPSGYPYPSDGMTLRDYFAAKALPMAWDFCRRIRTDDDDDKADRHECTYDMDVDPDDGDDDCGFVAAVAYRMADAMLNVRVRKGDTP